MGVGGDESKPQAALGKGGGDMGMGVGGDESKPQAALGKGGGSRGCVCVERRARRLS